MEELIKIALNTKSLYDLSENRIALGHRIRQYGLKKNTNWMEIFKEYQRLEKVYEKELKKLITQTRFASMLAIKGLGPRIIGGLLMHLINSKRICSKTKKDKNGDPKYLGTQFLNELRSFNSCQSLIHFAGQHLRCKNCGYSEKDCKCGNYKPVIAKERKGLPVDWSPKFRKWLLSAANSLYRSSANDAPYELIYKRELLKSKERPKRKDWTLLHHKNHARRKMIRQLLKDFYNNFLRS